MMTIAEQLASAVNQLREVSASARLDAELLLEHVTGWPRSVFLAYPERAIADEACTAFTGLLARRAQGEPIAYLIGVREFWSLRLEVTPAVLIPRPETELLVDLALAQLRPERPAQVLDLGTGSGAIALAIAKERPNAIVTATDISTDALQLAQRNAERLGLASVRFVAGEWLAPVRGQIFDLIVSNPPYVAAGDSALEPHVRGYEPTRALIPGPSGLEAFESIVCNAPGHLAAGGWLLLEHGWEQGAAVRALLVQAGFAHVRSHPDLAGKERVTTGRWQDQACPVHSSSVHRNQGVMLQFQTSKGNFTVELFEDKAPISATNFLAYVDAGFFDGLIFHRVIPGFMIQGGGFTPDMQHKNGNAPIANEANNGVKNKRGTLAMARTNDINSATSQFFINVVDNGPLDHRPGGPSTFGYAVFGQVTDGMDVVDAIAAVKTGRHGPHSDVPVEPVIIQSVKRV